MSKQNTNLYTGLTVFFIGFIFFLVTGFSNYSPNGCTTTLATGLTCVNEGGSIPTYFFYLLIISSVIMISGLILAFRKRK